ncbi:HMG box-containing protein 4-like [Protopterus annectens]|uniref:HMG box-containing protein 4-like n=1 Tax=Protopterus annectens TaxID=7888 RepID=UPI001CFB05FC|nr:HMG box-containing protein 4-like [Protopterus annectens]
MAYSDLKKKDCLVSERGIEELSLVAGRTQREKKRSYKDLLREEEEIAAQVKKTSKKRPKVNCRLTECWISFQRRLAMETVYVELYSWKENKVIIC